jgi:Zn-dependent M16 (insulinase) family peptidase
MAEISHNVYLHRPLINQFRLQNEREIAVVTNTQEKQQILKNNLVDFGKCNNNNFLNNNNLIDNRNSSENSSRRKEPQHLYVSSPSQIHASQMNDIKVSMMKNILN